MKEQRTLELSACARVSYPVFTDENAPKQAGEMNAFYEALRDAALAYAAELNEGHKDGIRLLAAEYTAEVAGERITVTYTVSVRRRGRVIGRKQLIHIWENGVLIPPRRGRGKG